jgi:biopolymer transport protein ExbD
MNTRTIIRLIDIVFILLFGFVSVSQVSSIKTIEPPKSTEASEAEPEGARIITVGVEKDGNYPIDGGEVVFQTLNDLRSFFAEAREKQPAMQQIGVRIRAHWESPLEYSIAVARICKDLGLPKGLDVVRVK